MSEEAWVKPRLRGRSHQLAALACLPASWALLSVARPGEAFWGSAVFMGALLLLFTTSATYHLVEWTPRGLDRMRRVDHGMIFMAIAGFYTPYCLLALPPAIGHSLLWAVWIGAFLGLARVVFWPYAPRWVAVAAYAIVSIFALPVLPLILAALSPTAIIAVTVGNSVVGVGALCYMFGRPDPWPAWFGHHEIFHLTVVIAGAGYYVGVWTLAA